MALALSKAAPLRPDIKLSQALKDYEAILSDDQRESFRRTSPLESNDVMMLTVEINRQNAGRRSRTWGARLTTFLNSVKGFTSVVDIIIANAGSPIAGAVWGAVKTAIQAASAFESYFDALSTMSMNVGQSAPRYEKYALLYPASASLRQELCNYFTVVITLCKTAVLFVRKSFISQAMNALRKPFDDEFGKFQKDLVKFGDAVREEVSLAAKQQQDFDSRENSLFRKAEALFHQEAAHGLKEGKKWRKFRFKSHLLNSCSTYNHETALNQARRKGSSSWIFENNDYKKLKSSNSPSVLLCSGIVGAGKTVLSSSVIENLKTTEAAGVSVGYFFCRYEDFESLKARNIIGSLARQLLNSVPIKQFDKVDRDIGDITLNIEQVVSHILQLLPPSHQYIFVLDGLDECESEEVYRLFEALQNLFRSPTQIFRLFWTGRSDFVARVSRRFQSDLHVTISQSNNGPEISNWIELALDEVLANGRLQLCDPQIICKIQDALESESCGMFLWVTFQIESLCCENTDEGILKALEDLPKDLPTTFRRILRRLRDSGSIDVLTGKKIFELVAAARRPLTMEELREAISIEPGNTTWSTTKLVSDVMKSLDCCGSLVVVDEELLTIHFAHSSIKQHLETEPDKLDISEYHIDHATSNLTFGKIIVTYLNLDFLQKPTITANKASQTSATLDVSLLLRSGLPQSTIASSLARKLLKNRKTPGYDVRRDLENVAGFKFKREPEVLPQQADSLLSYAQQHWLSHTESFETLKFSDHYQLWTRLIEGGMETAELRWTLDDARTLNAQFLDSVIQCRNPSLIEYTLRKVPNQHYWEDLRAQSLLELLPPQKTSTSVYRWEDAGACEHFLIHAVTHAAKSQNMALARLILEKRGTNLKHLGNGLLRNALRTGSLPMFNFLLDNFLDVDALDMKNMMGVAAYSSIAKQAIPLLLEIKPRERFFIEEWYSEEVKQLLQRNNDLCR